MARAGLLTVQLRFKSQDAAAIRAEIRAGRARCAARPACCSSTTTGEGDRRRCLRRAPGPGIDTLSEADLCGSEACRPAPGPEHAWLRRDAARRRRGPQLPRAGRRVPDHAQDHGHASRRAPAACIAHAQLRAQLLETGSVASLPGNCSEIASSGVGSFAVARHHRRRRGRSETAASLAGLLESRRGPAGTRRPRKIRATR